MIAVLLDLSVKATILCLAASAAAAMMGRASAASRHLVWTGMFVAVLALPIARVFMPGLPVFVLAPEVVEIANAAPPTQVLSVDPAAAAPAPSSAASSLVMPPAAATSAVVTQSQPRASLSLRDLAGPVWICGVVLMLLRAVAGRSRVHQLNRAASPVTDPAVLGRVRDLRRLFGVRRPIAVRTSPEWMPMTWGVLRPVILAPAAIVGADANRRDVLEPLLVHEVAHIARFDIVSAAIARVAVALGWFHPLLWFAARQARLERERACDDAVLTRGANPKASDYANQLLLLAQTSRALADGSHTLAMARRSQLEARIRAILDARTNRRSTSHVSRIVAVTLVLVALPVAAVRLAGRTIVVPTGVPTAYSSNAVDVEPARPPEPKPVQTASRSTVSQSPAVPAAVSANCPGAAPVPGWICSKGSWVPAGFQGVTPPPASTQAQPLPPTYRIGVNDLLAVIVWRAPELSGDVRVGTDGKIVLPRGNPVPAAGETTEGLKELVTAELKRCCMANPDVIIQVKEILQALHHYPVNDPRAQPALASFFFFNIDDWGTAWRQLSAHELEAERGLARRVEIGRSAPIDLNGLRPARQAIDSALEWSRQHPDVRLTDVLRGYTEAVRKLNVVKVRYDNGLAEPKELADAYIAAAEALKGVVPPPAPLSDAALTRALKDAATIGTDAGKANTLLELAQTNAFTPEMVALYVAAANSITTDADRARVFAQPIRVK